MKNSSVKVFCFICLSIFVHKVMGGDILTWPHNTIYYKLDQSITEGQSSTRKSTVIEAMDNIQNLTCIKFVEDNNKLNGYVHITNSHNFLSSATGYKKNQVINVYLDFSDSNVYGKTLHELMHVLGFPHEHGRQDRDENVQIIYSRIPENQRFNFEKRPTKVFPEVRFDWESILMYPTYAFSGNKSPTILPKEEHKNMGQRIKLSPLNIYSINYLYECPQLQKLKEEAAEKLIGPAKTAGYILHKPEDI